MAEKRLIMSFQWKNQKCGKTLIICSVKLLILKQIYPNAAYLCYKKILVYYFEPSFESVSFNLLI